MDTTKEFLRKWADVKGWPDVRPSPPPMVPEDGVRKYATWADLTTVRALAPKVPEGPFFLVLFNDDERTATDPIRLRAEPVEFGAELLNFEKVTIKVGERSVFTHHLLFNADRSIRRTKSFDGPINVHPEDSFMIRISLSLKDLPNG